VQQRIPLSRVVKISEIGPRGSTFVVQHLGPAAGATICATPTKAWATRDSSADRPLGHRRSQCDALGGPLLDGLGPLLDAGACQNGTGGPLPDPPPPRVTVFQALPAAWVPLFQALRAACVPPFQALAIAEATCSTAATTSETRFVTRAEREAYRGGRTEDLPSAGDPERTSPHC
jgi:hypothetical protein